METIVKNAGMKLLKQPRQPLPLLNLLAIMTCTMREHLKQITEHVWTAPDNKGNNSGQQKIPEFHNKQSSHNKAIYRHGREVVGATAVFLQPSISCVSMRKKDRNQQTWNMDGGDDLLEKYDELDPRFAQTIAAHGANWNTEIGILNFSARWSSQCSQ